MFLYILHVFLEFIVLPVQVVYLLWFCFRRDEFYRKEEYEVSFEVLRDILDKIKLSFHWRSTYV